jgi:hypothetical protein
VAATAAQERLPEIDAGLDLDQLVQDTPEDRRVPRQVVVDPYHFDARVERPRPGRRRERERAIRARVLRPGGAVGGRREQAAEPVDAAVEHVLAGRVLGVEPLPEPDRGRRPEDRAGRAERQMQKRAAHPPRRRRVGYAAAREEALELSGGAAGERARPVGDARHTHMFSPCSSLR